MIWKVYNELAWTENILADPESYEEETITFIDALLEDGEYKLKMFIGTSMF